MQGHFPAEFGVSPDKGTMNFVPLRVEEPISQNCVDFVYTRCRKHPAGGLVVSPKLKYSPKIGGYRGLILTGRTIPPRLGDQGS